MVPRFSFDPLPVLFDNISDNKRPYDVYDVVVVVEFGRSELEA